MIILLIIISLRATDTWTSTDTNNAVDIIHTVKIKSNFPSYQGID